jgi:hypothetical protein
MTAIGFLASILPIFLTTNPCLDLTGMSDSFVRSSPSKILSRKFKILIRDQNLFHLDGPICIAHRANAGLFSILDRALFGK